MHVQIGVGYVLAPDTGRSDVCRPPPVGLSQLVTSIYENGLDPARELGEPEKMTMLSRLSRWNTKVSSLNT